MSSNLELSAQAMFHAIRMWRAAAEDLGAASAMVHTLKLPSTSAIPTQPGVSTPTGPFNEALDKYQPAPDYFKERVDEGVSIFVEIADVLEEVLRQYSESDESFAAEIRRLAEQVGGGNE